MKIYFEHIDAIHQFTMELNYHYNTLKCKYCQNCNQFVSHGFVYKKQNNGEKKAVGKRLFCSNRHGKLGCGRTTRLYLAILIPTFQYTNRQIFIFLSALLSMSSIQKAYKLATNTDDPRNAYRWLHKLWNKLIDYRCFLNLHTQCESFKFKFRARRLQILLPTIHELFLKIKELPCTQYQMLTQTSFA
ncbi:MAG: hypothetical protein PHY93_17775 [Bacteriovorax sp.]|nr:hypothetical protein [Bacteriovorax sp.]